MKNKGVLVACFTILIALNFVMADVILKEADIERFYYGGEPIRGNIKIVLNNEPSNSLLTSNFGKKIKLIELLEKNNMVGGQDYICIPEDCSNRYESNSQLNYFGIEQNKKKFVGLRILGSKQTSIEEIINVGLEFIGSAGPSCQKQIDIEFMEQEDIRFSNTKTTGRACTEQKDYGCFTQNSSGTIEVEIHETPLCEKITLKPAPSYLLGARVRNSTNNFAGDLTMELRSYENFDSILGKCILPKHKINVEELECQINYSISKEANYTICISGEESSLYTIRSETNSPLCGTSNLGRSYLRDFEIFARPLEFDRVHIKLNGSMILQEGNLNQKIYDYIEKKYNGICYPECVIPLSFSGLTQDIEVIKAEIRYREEDGIISSSNGIYSINTKMPKISSGNITLKLEPAQLLLPLETNISKLELYLGNKKIYSGNISISPSFDFSITPSVALIGLNTELKIISSSTITQSKWNINGDIKKVSSDKIIYRFNEAGNYNIEVEATQKDGTTGIRRFTLIAGNSKYSAELLISEYEKRLHNFTTGLDLFETRISEEIKKSINLTALNNSLVRLKEEYQKASTDSQYDRIVSELLSLNFPHRAYIKIQGEKPLYSNFEDFDVEMVYSISNISGSYKEDKLKESIAQWMKDNFDAKMTFKEYGFLSDQGTNKLFTQYRIETIRKKDLDYDAYLFIGYPKESIIFLSNYGFKESASGAYVKLEKQTNIFDFIVYDASPKDIISFISPVAEKLIVKNQSENKALINYALWAGIFVFLIFIFYIVVQELIKRKHEAHLFKNRNDLYNLINFIYNSRRGGVRDSETKRRLLQVGWKNEQINYAFNKMDGKRSAFEIPLFKKREENIIKKEISKRQASPIDARFIKGPRL